jgi:ABC-2 type transport system permease protein
LKGADLAILWDSVLAMALLGGVLLGFGTWRFGRRLQ